VTAREEEGKPAQPTGRPVTRAAPASLGGTDEVDRLGSEPLGPSMRVPQGNLHRSRADLEAVLAEYTSLFELAPVAYLVVGVDGSIRRANSAAARLFGVDASRLFGLRLAAYVVPADVGVFDDVLAAVFGRTREGAEGPRDLRVELAGNVRHLRISAVALPRPESESLVALLAVEDITERKRDEEHRLV